MAQFLGNLVVDEIGHVDVFLVAGGTRRPVIPQRVLHLIDAPRDIVHLILGQLLVVGRLVLEVDVLVHVAGSRTAHGMILGSVNHFILGAVHLHDVSTRDRVTALARVGQINAVFALGDDLGEDIHTIVSPVEEKFAETALGGIFHPWSGHLKGQHVTHHALVGIRGQQGPVVVLAHAQDIHLLLDATIFQRLVQRAEGVRFLVTHAERRTATITQCHIALVVDGLTGMSHRVGIVELTLTVVQNLHAGRDAFIAVDVLPINIKPHDGQIGGRQLDILVVGRVIPP